MSERDEALAKIDAQLDKFNRLIEKYGYHGLAKKVMKLPSYRAYVQKWPFDFTTPIESLEGIEDEVEQGGISVEDEVAARIDVQTLEAGLTPKQVAVYNLIIQGLKHAEIKDIEGFNTESAVRFHKHTIKKKYNQIKDE